MKKIKEEIDLDARGKSEKKIKHELEKSEVNMMHFAIVSQLEKAHRHEEGAKLNNEFAKLGKHQLQKRMDILRPYADLLE